MNWLRGLAGVPFLDRAVILQAGIAANPGALGDFIKQLVLASFFSNGF